MAGPTFIQPVTKSLGMASAIRRLVESSATQSAPTDETSAALQNLVGSTPQTVDTLLGFEANISKPWTDPDPDKTSTLFRDMIENTVSGQLKSVDAVQRADKQMGTILNP
jgi:hypothetical protein